jgi:glyoxylase-like metal-dependent hydrolase (beta-lactamase superfamily II)
MRMIAPGVWQFAGFPPDMFNVYLVDDMLVDAGTRWARSRILRQLGGRVLRRVVLTHCHPDHQGAAAAICQRFRVPLACHEADVPAMEGRVPMQPENTVVRLGQRFWSGAPYPVQHILRDGDRIGAFRVVHAPGHTQGHIMLFRESDRLAIAGDVLANIHFFTGKPGLREPPPFASVDPAQNRRSIQLLAALQPAVVCFGHGPPLYDSTLLERLAARVGRRTPQSGG